VSGSPYAEFARRKGMEMVAPVIAALNKGKQKYGN
jgi:hypothetical protein